MISIAGFALSVMFATNAGLYILDIMDNFINNYGIVVVGLLETLLIGWIIKPKVIREHTNAISYFKIGKWWDFIIKFVAPTLLTVALVQSLIKEINETYGGYDLTSVTLYGWLVVAIAIIGSIIMSKRPWNKTLDAKDKEVV